MMIEGSRINRNSMDRMLQKIWGLVSLEDWTEAEILLNTLIKVKPWDKKFLLYKAQLRKNMWLASDKEDYALLEDAIHLYSRCHLLTGGAEAGINTATLLLISGNDREAYRKAAEVAKHCRALILDGVKERDGYYAAIIAEANLIRGRLEAAETWYETAHEENSTIADIFQENMNLLLEHIVPESSTVKRIRQALRA